MNQKNTTKIGNEFEDKVFDIFNTQLSNDKLFINGKYSKIFKKKAYYSKDREKNIITDISIETTMPNADKYSLLTVLECKNYSQEHTVPIDDLEEFVSKLSQIAGHNVKGVMVTNSKYSDTGLTYARNKGIGLIRILNDEIKNEIYRKSRFGEYNGSNDIISIIKGEMPPLKPHYVVDNYYRYDNISSYLLLLGIIDDLPVVEKPDIKVPYLTLEEIETIKENILPNNSNIIESTDLFAAFQKLNQIEGINLIINEHLGLNNGKEILGKISFDTKTIYVSSNLEANSHRWRFTLAHELGHLLLHTEVLSKMYDEAIDTENSLNNDIIIDNKALKRIEYQANLFASVLLMPKIPFLSVTQVVFQQNNVNRGRLYLDRQPCNQELFYNVAKTIGSIFNVSMEAVKYRLISLELLENNSGITIRDILV